MKKIALLVVGGIVTAYSLRALDVGIEPFGREGKLPLYHRAIAHRAKEGFDNTIIIDDSKYKEAKMRKGMAVCFACTALSAFFGVYYFGIKSLEAYTNE